MFYVVGSGPAGIACAVALLEKGSAVTMLDAGLELPTAKKDLIKEAATTWDKNDLKKLKHQLQRKNPLKLSYGSSYVYDEVDEHFNFIMGKNLQVFSSFATGGLSNVWGAVVKSYDEEDLANWPISLQQLKPYYQKIQDIICAGQDFQSSQQANFLLNYWKSRKEILSNLGFSFNKPELAVNFNSCRYCGFCQHGCPGEFIYSAAHSLRILKQHPKFYYKKNLIVDEITESDNEVIIVANDRLTREKTTLKGDRVFLACGALISTMILLKSKKIFNRKIYFNDSTHFMVPCLMSQRFANVQQEKLHTLCQLMLFYNNNQQKSALQVYSYMDHYAEKTKWLPKSLLERLLVIQGFLPSAVSHRFFLEIKSDLSMQLQRVDNPFVAIAIKEIVNQLKKNRLDFGFNPIVWLMQVSKTGKSFHYGGSFPMAKNPNDFEADIYGRALGYQRCHLIDAAIFPSIPAGPITYTVMANAYRIGEAVI